MSKYTTEVRFICESLSGLEESKGFSDIDNVIDDSWDQIFTTNVTFFDPTYKSVLCKKILKHYYLREICSETVGIWKLWMNERLENIMPYYNQMYESALIEFNPMHDVNVTRTYERGITGAMTGGGTNTENANDTSRDLYSDTPQGAITGLESETYLTDARKITSERGATGAYTSNSNTNSTEAYVETLIGKHGSGTYSKMIQEFRETFLNIDAMVIEEFNDLFFGLW